MKPADIRRHKEKLSTASSSFSPLPPGGIKPEIWLSWLRSQKNKLNPHIIALPDWTRDKSTAENNLEYTDHFHEFDESLYSLQHKVLENFGSAVFYLNQNLSVFAKFGSEDILKDLKAKNIGFSTSFQEHVIGTNAASLAFQDRKEILILGEEHYMDLLTDYATFAVPCFRNERNYQLDKYGLLFFAPLDRITTQVIDYFRYMASVVITLTNQATKPINLIKRRYLSLYSQSKNNCVLMMDEKGIIIDINDDYCRTFNKTVDQTCGRKLLDLYPGLADLVGKVQGKECSVSGSLSLDSDNKKIIFYAECTSIWHQRHPIGMVVTLTDSKHVRDYMNQIINNSAHFTFADLIGRNKEFMHNIKLAEQASTSSSNVLICGESGTGKELFAQAIHNNSNRRQCPFVAINCAAIPKELIASELFGYTDGAFTGSKKGGAMGKFEQAHKGTIFLDEIAEMPLDMQSVLLRVIEEQRITRLGSSHTETINVRIIAATNRNLLQSVSEGRFRLDLYYRLNVIRLDLLPLRLRQDDLTLLINHFLQLLNQKLGKDILGVKPDVMDVFYKHTWPGNVRELRNVLERCVNLETTDYIQLQTLPLELLYAGTSQSTPAESKTISDALMVPKSPEFSSFEEIEQNRLIQLMKQYNGNKRLVAEVLGISRPTLYRRLAKIKSWT